MPPEIRALWLPANTAINRTTGAPAPHARAWLSAHTLPPQPHLDAWLGTPLRWTALDAGTAAVIINNAQSAATSNTSFQTAIQPLGVAGYWTYLIDPIQPGEGLNINNNQTTIVWLPERPQSALSITPLLPQQLQNLAPNAAETLMQAIAPLWSDPTQRWRIRLLADRFPIPTRELPNANNPIIEEIAAQHERFWRDALATLAQRDQQRARRAIANLYPIIKPAPDIALPAFIPNPNAEWTLLTAILDPASNNQRIDEAIAAIEQARPPYIAWITDDRDPAINAAELRAAPLRIAAAPPDQPSGPTTRVPPLTTTPIPINTDQSSREQPPNPREPRPINITAAAGTQRLILAPTALPLTPPGFRINTLWNAWSLANLYTNTPLPAQTTTPSDTRPRPTTAAMLLRDDVNHQWLIHIECLTTPPPTHPTTHPAPTQANSPPAPDTNPAPAQHTSDELIVWLALPNQPPTRAIVTSSANFQPADDILQTTLTAHAATPSRWRATIAFNPPTDATNIAIAIERRIAATNTDSKTVHTDRAEFVSSWPRPRFPAEPADAPPGLVGFDLSRWNADLAAAPTFDFNDEPIDNDRAPNADPIERIFGPE